MKEIQLRIIELEQRLDILKNTRRRAQRFHHNEEIASVVGEIAGLRWALNHCFNVSEPNVIEQ